MFNAKNLSFYYKEKLVFSDVNFTLPQGSITGLVGANGAGKTTLMRCMAGLYNPYHGTVSIDDIDVHELPHQAHQKMGYLSDSFGLYPHLTVQQSLEYTALLFNIDADELQTRMDVVLEQVNLTQQKQQQTQTLSRGQRQRLGIAQAIIHQPDFLLLDEPASGLDPQARIELSSLLKKLQKQGMTILVSSHILAELDEYCTHLMILQNQKMTEFTALQDINYSTEKHKTLKVLKKLQVVLAQNNEAESIKLEQTLHTLQELNNFTENIDFHYDVEKNVYTFYWVNDADAKHQLLKILMEQDFAVVEFKTVQENLQERYLKQMNVQ